MAQVWLNGTFFDEAEAGVSVRDAGLLHSVGVFTTLRAAHGQVVRLRQHLERIRASCELFFIPLQYQDTELIHAFAELLEKNNLTDARLRLTVTRGASSQDPVNGLRLEPNAFITATPFEAYPATLYENGMTVIALDSQKLNPYDIQAGHKTLNYLSRLSALREANQLGAGEALWFNVNNYLQSGSISNVFIVKNAILHTPPTQSDLHEQQTSDSAPYPQSNVLPGITRQAVLEWAGELSLPVKTNALTINDVLEADELFLTNSIMGVMPVCRVERKPIGSEKPGKITKKLLNLWNDSLSV